METQKSRSTRTSHLTLTSLVCHDTGELSKTTARSNHNANAADISMANFVKENSSSLRIIKPPLWLRLNLILPCYFWIISGCRPVVVVLVEILVFDGDAEAMGGCSGGFVEG